MAVDPLINNMGAAILVAFFLAVKCIIQPPVKRMVQTVAFVGMLGASANSAAAQQVDP